MRNTSPVVAFPLRAASPSPWRTWVLLPLWVYGLFIFVNLAQYLWMLLAASYHGVPFGKVADGSLKSPAVELIRGLAGPSLGVPFLAFALRFLGPRGLDWSVLRFRPRDMALGAAMASAAILGLMGILMQAGVATVTGWPGRLPAGSLAALVGGKLLWSVFKSALEDILFIGVLARVWAPGRSWRGAALGMGIFFGAIHLPNILPVLTLQRAVMVMVWGATFGALLTLLAARYRSLWVPIGFHAAWNLWLGTVLGTTLSGQKGLGGLLVTELNGPTWLTGDFFGVEASWLSVLVTGAILVWCARGGTASRGASQPIEAVSTSVSLPHD